MKQTVLGQSPAEYKKRLRRRIFLCGLLSAFTLAGNILSAAARTEENHTLLLVLNILSDIACGFFLVYFIDVHILPGYRLWALTEREKTTFEGTLTHISTVSLRYMDIDCYAVTVNGRRLFLPAKSMLLCEQETYRFRITANIILEAEQ